MELGGCRTSVLQGTNASRDTSRAKQRTFETRLCAAPDGARSIEVWRERVHAPICVWVYHWVHGFPFDMNLIVCNGHLALITSSCYCYIRNPNTRAKPCPQQWRGYHILTFSRFLMQYMS
eukprot:9478991-Pyramimonas_sp.AAC.1